MSCEKCRYHSKSSRAKVVDVADEDMEIVEFDEETIETVYGCTHADQPGREIGIGPQAGEGCALYAIGARRGLDPALEQRLAWRTK